MEEFILKNIWIILLIVLWQTPWKGVALWKAARLEDHFWFIVILLVQTIGILDILYIFVISMRKKI